VVIPPIQSLCPAGGRAIGVRGERLLCRLGQRLRTRTVDYFTEMCSGSEAGSYLRLIDVCITQLNERLLRGQRFLRPRGQRLRGGLVFEAHRLLYHSLLDLIRVSI